MRPSTYRDSLTSEVVPLPRAARVHFLKCWPTFFDAIVRGEKKAELRQDDGRGFRVGDVFLIVRRAA